MFGLPATERVGMAAIRHARQSKVTIKAACTKIALKRLWAIIASLFIAMAIAYAHLHFPPQTPRTDSRISVAAVVAGFFLAVAGRVFARFVDTQRTEHDVGD